jgi:tRNA (Thr-GGU) A37 N-methylase
MFVRSSIYGEVMQMKRTLGLHRVTVREISGTRLRIGPIEAIDGTPVIDVKVVLVEDVGLNVKVTVIN